MHHMSLCGIRSPAIPPTLLGNGLLCTRGEKSGPFCRSMTEKLFSLWRWKEKPSVTISDIWLHHSDHHTPMQDLFFLSELELVIPLKEVLLFPLKFSLHKSGYTVLGKSSVPGRRLGCPPRRLEPLVFLTKLFQVLYALKKFKKDVRTAK